jgi:hypothetical protein
LFLAKLCLEAAQFEEAYLNFLKCLKHREHLPNNDPAKIDIELNLMNFYKVLKSILEKHKEVLNIEEKKLADEKKK